jgi:hypothetical protein
MVEEKALALARAFSSLSLEREVRPKINPKNVAHF